MTSTETRAKVELDPEVEAEIEYAKAHPDPPAVNGTHAGDSALLEYVRDHKIHKNIRKAPPKSPIEYNPPAVNGIVNVPRSEKNKRHSRSGRGRGDPKKDGKSSGGGGKFTWGAPGKVYEEPAYLDPNDPNYDSDSQGNVTFDEVEGEMSEGEFQKRAESTIREYFSSAYLRETFESMQDLSMSLSEEKRKEFVRLAIVLACDSKPSIRELTSELLSEAVNRRVLWPADISRAFSGILETDLPDMVVDMPSAAELVGNFMARATADLAMSSEVLKTMIQEKDKVANQHATAALDQAELMIAVKKRLHDIWGVGGGTKPVRFLVRQMQLILQEYQGSQDADEARRCLHELEVPHFHHQLVFQAGVMAIEAMHDRISNLLAVLLKELYNTGELTKQAIVTGFERLFAFLPELAIDVPPAYTLAERWTSACRTHGFVPDSVVNTLPQRGRKRYVSEGDGGRLKVIDVAHPLI